MVIQRIINALRGRPADVFVVWDTSGMGRLVGVFTDPKVASKIGEVNKPYYRVMPCSTDTVSEKIHGWISPEKEQLIYDTVSCAKRE